MLWCLPVGGATPLLTVDSLLNDYLRAPEQYYQLGQHIVDLCLGDDPLNDRQLRIDNSLPEDSANLLVFFAAERYYFIHSYFDKSLEYIGRALPLSEDGNEEIHATLLCDNCYCLFKQGNMTEAAQAGQKAMEFCLGHDQPMQLARSYLYLAIVNYSIPQIEQAKQFVEKALSIDHSMGTNKNTHNILGIACEIYSFAGETQRAIDYGIEAVEAARAIGYDEGVVNHLSQLSYAYNRQGEYEQGLVMAQKAVETVEQMEIPDRNLLAISLEYVAYNLLDMKRNDEAVPVLLRAIDLEREVGNVRSVCYDHKALAEAYEPNEPRQAIAALRQYIVMADSIHNADMEEALSKANARFHNEELQEENIEHQRQNRLLLLIGIIVALLLIAIIIYFVYAYRKRGKANLKLRQRQQQNEMFFTNVTHEFRTPLTIIMGHSRELQKEGQTEVGEIIHSGQIIEHECNRLLQLVNQMLDMAKIRMAATAIQWKRENIVPLLGMLTESLQQIAHEGGISLSYEAQDKEQKVVFVTDYIQKIVRNLLMNALKNTPAGGKVTLTSCNEGEQLLLTVSDTGKGINPEDLPHIFDPFYQSKNNTTRKGTGIGLTVTKQMVKAMHGTISVKSIPDSGTTFTISLPLRQKGVELSKSTPPSSVKEDNTYTENYKAPQLIDSSTNDDDQRKQVLIVEDNREVAHYTGSLLMRHYDVFYAEDGEQGLEKALQIVPDLIITDLMMPRMDGLQLCRHIRQEELTCHIPIIIVTAKVTQESHLQGLEAGATAYLNKPFSVDELLLLVNNLLLQQQLLQQRFAHKEELEHGTTRDVEQEEDSHEIAESLDQRFITDLNKLVKEMLKEQHTEVDYLAPLMKMSQRQLRRKITAVTGMSPAKYIMQMRMEEAKEQLKNYPDVTIIEVAFNTGFADNAHFTKVFHRYTGMTPLQYINSLR